MIAAKLPAVQPNSKNGSHYRRLAELARARGHDKVTASVIQLWVKDGLLPRMRYEQPAFGVRLPVGLAAIEQQLLALCDLRYANGVRSHAELALALWIAGWEVAEGDVRKAFDHYLAPMAALADPSARENFADKAAQQGKLPARWRRSEKTQTALALETLFALTSGARLATPDDHEELAHLERVSHLDRARRDTVDGVGPWLPTSPGVGLAGGAEGMSVPRIRDAIEHAAFADLCAACDRARLIARYFAIAGPMIELAAGQDFAGFGAIADAADDPRFPIMLVLVALGLPKEAAEFVDLLPGDEVLVEWDEATLEGRRLVVHDPQLAARATSFGLVTALTEDGSRGGGGD